jgi:hypothetical protein
LTQTEPATEGEIRTPEESAEEVEWHHHHHNGELPDTNTVSALELAHKAVAKFPDLAKRYQKYIGTAAVLSSAVIVLASIAIAKRQHRGESAERILAEITPEEIESMAAQRTENPKKPRRGITRFLLTRPSTRAESASPSAGAGVPSWRRQVRARHVRNACARLCAAV